MRLSLRTCVTVFLSSVFTFSSDPRQRLIIYRFLNSHVFTSQAFCFCAWIPFICLWKFWRTVKAEIFAGFVVCLPLSELIRCRLKTQSRHQERKSSMAYFRGRKDCKTLNPAHSRVPANESRSGGESVCEREGRGGGRVAVFACV